MSRVDIPAVEARSRVSPRPRPGRAVLAGALVLVALIVLATRMIPHPVGPARTDSKYQGKAVTTARSAQSAVATTALVARAYNGGNAFGPYATVVATDAESGVSGVQGTFDSIQPPSKRSDALQRELDQILSDASEHVRDVRVALRRSENPTEEDLHNLDDDREKLHAFIEAHS